MDRLYFIETIAPLVQKAYRELGKVKPSVCIAMACVECNFGNAGSVKYNSLLGQKVGTGRTATKHWDKTFFTAKTREEYKIGTHTVITDAFRSYKDFEQCIYNYYELLNTSLYKRVLAESPYDEQMKQIKLCGYMTSSTEVSTVLSIIKQYNLTKYDGENIKEEKKDDVRKHTVVRGNSLWSIAEMYYGDGWEWHRIYEANNLTSTVIKIGQVLIIP